MRPVAAVSAIHFLVAAADGGDDRDDSAGENAMAYAPE
jgi:hypothetical protein